MAAPYYPSRSSVTLLIPGDYHSWQEYGTLLVKLYRLRHCVFSAEDERNARTIFDD